MKKRSSKSRKKINVLIIIIIPVILISCYFYISTKKPLKIEKKEIKIASYKEKPIEELENFVNENELILEKEYQYSSTIKKDLIISQNIKEGTVLKKKDTIKVIISKGEIPISVLEENKVNELGNIPIMMYHGIHNLKDDETKYTKGNVDKDGYNRTAESFRKDLEFYYQNNYRMIRLADYVNGIINVPLGKSPIILTFDDGKENNFKVLGEKNGELEIDPNCAVGILEEYKKKYEDFNVTATFFINSTIFEQKEYNEKILKWLIEHGYDVGNHTMTHPDFTKITQEQALKEVGGMYQILENIIPGKYVKIIAMPFGSPYKSTHPNFQIMLKGNYEGVNYQTISMLRVGWEAEMSPFKKASSATFLKRIRAYDNNGKDFDITMNFNLLEKTRYISDGDINTVIIKEKDKDNIKTDKLVRTY